MSTYSEKLKDPRWQKKRLEIFQRDHFTCQACWDKQSTLHVHHKYYLPGKDPWDYPESCLVTLCEGCHANEMENEGYRLQFLNAFCDFGFLNSDFENTYEFIGMLRGKIKRWEMTYLIENLTTDDFWLQVKSLLYPARPKSDNEEPELDFS